MSSGSAGLGKLRVRQLEVCDARMFGDVIMTCQTFPAVATRMACEETSRPLKILQRVRHQRTRSEGSGLDVERDKRRASLLMDQLLVEIYGSSIHNCSDYNSATSSQRSQKIFIFEKYELERKNPMELQSLIDCLHGHVCDAGKILVRQLKRRDALRRQREARCDVITKHLRKRFPENIEMHFSLEPGPGDSGFSQWHSAMKMVAQLPEGIPPEFRRRLWLALADKHLLSRNVDWQRAEKNCFSEWSHPADSELGVQIVKDLHRTGCSLFCGEDGQENQALLKRVLLAYARWNKAVGYCQGFNMLAALILQVTDKCEADALKLMIYLIEGVLPDSYFADSLRGLSVDMAVFRELLRSKLPRLSRHLDALQTAAKEGTTSYEPPLTNVFTMQWFLTLFCNCLPQPTVLRVWDLILLEGNEILLRTALAIWQALAERILAVRSADEFYSIMGVLTREMLEFGILDANALIKSVVTIGPLDQLPELREHYLYNINPWSAPALNPTTPDCKQVKLYSKEKLVLDIGVLKKQYSKLKQRQRQAHIIFNAAVARQPQGIVAPIAVNHLLLGKSALLTARRLGPPKGAIPPARIPEPPRRRSPPTSSSSSSDTELCDDPENPSSDEHEPDTKTKAEAEAEAETEAEAEAGTEDLPPEQPDTAPMPDLDTIKNEQLPPTAADVEGEEVLRSESVESDDAFDFERFLDERLRTLKEAEEDRLQFGRKNSERALRIMHENSLILHRILQCQAKTFPPLLAETDDGNAPTPITTRIMDEREQCASSTSEAPLIDLSLSPVKASHRYSAELLSAQRDVCIPEAETNRNCCKTEIESSDARIVPSQQFCLNADNFDVKADRTLDDSYQQLMLDLQSSKVAASSSKSPAEQAPVNSDSFEAKAEQTLDDCSKKSTEPLLDLEAFKDTLVASTPWKSKPETKASTTLESPNKQEQFVLNKNDTTLGSDLLLGNEWPSTQISPTFPTTIQEQFLDLNAKCSNKNNTTPCNDSLPDNDWQSKSLSTLKTSTDSQNQLLDLNLKCLNKNDTTPCSESLPQSDWQSKLETKTSPTLEPSSSRQEQFLDLNVKSPNKNNTTPFSESIPDNEWQSKFEAATSPTPEAATSKQEQFLDLNVKSFNKNDTTLCSDFLPNIDWERKLKTKTSATLEPLSRKQEPFLDLNVESLSKNDTTLFSDSLPDNELQSKFETKTSPTLVTSSTRQEQFFDLNIKCLNKNDTTPFSEFVADKNWQSKLETKISPTLEALSNRQEQFLDLNIKSSSKNDTTPFSDSQQDNKLQNKCATKTSPILKASSSKQEQFSDSNVQRLNKNDTTPCSDSLPDNKWESKFEIKTTTTLDSSSSRQDQCSDLKVKFLNKNDATHATSCSDSTPDNDWQSKLETLVSISSKQDQLLDLENAESVKNDNDAPCSDSLLCTDNELQSNVETKTIEEESCKALSTVQERLLAVETNIKEAGDYLQRIRNKADMRNSNEKPARSRYERILQYSKSLDDRYNSLILNQSVSMEDSEEAAPVPDKARLLVDIEAVVDLTAENDEEESGLKIDDDYCLNEDRNAFLAKIENDPSSISISVVAQAEAAKSPNRATIGECSHSKSPIAKATFNPFPVDVSARQSKKDVAVKLGLYSTNNNKHK